MICASVPELRDPYGANTCSERSTRHPLWSTLKQIEYLQNVLSLSSSLEISQCIILSPCRYSRSPPGAVLAALLGTVAGWLITNEGTTWAYGTYKFDNMDANLKFIEWWRKKSTS